MKYINALVVAPIALALTVPVTPLTPAAVAIQQPKVTLRQGTYGGVNVGNGIDSFLGIPFAGAPRFASPIPIASSNDAKVIPASAYGPICYQQSSTSGSPASGDVSMVMNTPFFQSVQPAIDAEECLNINVLRPAGATGLLPVVLWIYGGGFEFGSNGNGNNGTTIVARSIANDEPVLFVNPNYRLNGLGFMPGNEIDAAGAGNLGLQDQRAALEWVQDNIAKFGGDPNKVTIWGESAGGISVALQMVHAGRQNKGKTFRAAFSQSGAPIPMGSIRSTASNDVYQNFAKVVGCDKAASILTCLRTVPYVTLKNAIETTQGILTYQSLALTWRPRVDSVFLPTAPFDVVASGDYARVPYLNGDCDDEGTFFALTLSNVTTEQQFRDYIQQFYMPPVAPGSAAATEQANDLASLAALYTSDPTIGSPYNTSFLNTITPQFKRLSSILGDVVFDAPRRNFFKEYVNTGAPLWAYVFKRGKNTPVLGAYHGSDIAQFFPSASGTNRFQNDRDYQFIDYLINFATNLDPNTPVGGKARGLVNWPQHTATEANMLTFTDVPDVPALGLNGLSITLDNFRVAAMAGLTTFSKKYGGTL